MAACRFIESMAAAPSDAVYDDASLEAGQSLGGYRIVRPLGAGGMGEIYEAVQVHTQARVALKVLRPQFFDSPRMRTRFVREAKALGRVHHPNVVQIADVGAEGEFTFLVMEVLDGEDLGALLRREAPLSPSASVDLLLPVIDAVATAHEQGVIHRDLKPQNIFLARDADGNVVPKVLDFGIAKLTDIEGEIGETDLTQTHAILGTAPYMAPEQMRGAKNATASSDQYALGAILYRCLTARVPYAGSSIVELFSKILEGPPVAPSRIRADVPPALDWTVLRALATRAETRFESLRDFGGALLALASPRARARYAGAFAGHDAGPPSDVSLYAANMDPRSDVRERAPSRALGMGGRRERRPGRAFAIGTAIVLAAGGLIAGGLWLASSMKLLSGSASAPAGPASYVVRVRVTPSSAEIDLDGVPVAVGAFTMVLSRDGSVHALDVSAAGYRPMEVRFRDAPPPETIALQPLPPDSPESSARPRRHRPRDRASRPPTTKNQSPILR